MTIRERIAFAADLPLEDALLVYRKIRTHVAVAKVGLSLFVEHGPKAVKAFLDEGAQVFLDLKLHDIPNTIELAAKQAARLGVSYATVHGAGGRTMLESALRGANEGAAQSGHAAPKLLAVTVLTSMDATSMNETGYSSSMDDQVLRLAKLAKSAGIPGLVCSAREVSSLRTKLGPDLFLCTPGIRFEPHSNGDDQQRIETPEAAIAGGSNLLVIGRPIYQSTDPARVVQAIVERLQAVSA